MAKLDTGMNLYDFNKQAMNQLTPMDPIAFNLATQHMVADISERSKYWMLLNNERKDYTVFIIITEEGTLNELKPTLNNRGQVLSIDKQSDNNYEIWIRDPETEENFVYYLFDYSFGIVEA